jgi:hypothetical protein
MKTKGQRVAELLDALDNGFILYKQHGDQVFDNKEFLVKFGEYYEMKGWGTAYGTIKDRIFEITQNPEEWKIFPNFNIKVNDYPYPWSTMWSKKFEENEG